MNGDCVYYFNVVCVFRYVAENSLDEMLVFGVKTSPSVVSLNGVALKSDQISYDDSVGSLLLRGLKQELHKGFVLEWN